MIWLDEMFIIMIMMIRRSNNMMMTLETVIDILNANAERGVMKW